MLKWNCGDYTRIERALRFIEAHAAEQPELAEIARAVHLSEFHFQRLFKRWAGISPKRFLQVVTLEQAKRSLVRRRSLQDAAWDAGLSGPSRLHDLFVSIEAVTPGEYKELGRGLRIEYGFHPTPFGKSLIGTTARGICHFGFFEEGGEEAALEDLRSQWRQARLCSAPQATRETVAKIFSPRKGEMAPLLVKGTNFQAKVWRALLRIPPGGTATYQELARQVCTERAARAVGNALAANSIAYLIPCHRVVRQLGAIGNYRWGAPRKKLMLAWEAGCAGI